MRNILLPALSLLTLLFMTGCGDDSTGTSKNQPPVFTISGTVVSIAGTALAGVTISDGKHTAATDSTGKYILELAQGTYSITLSKPAYNFTPPSRTLTVNDAPIAGADFTARQTSSHISGKVLSSSVDVSGIRVSDGTRNAVTDTKGIYSIENVPDGIYTLTASRDGTQIYPLSLTVVVSGTDIVNQNFTAGLPSFIPMISIPGTNSFRMMSTYEVTQKEWQEVMGSNPGYHKGDDYPIENVSWLDVAAFCNKLSQREGLEPCYAINFQFTTCDFLKNGYRMPTIGEWVYACRAGTTGDYYIGAMVGDGQNCTDAQPALDPIAWWCGNATETQRGGLKQPNAFGLYDMLGNVAEMCWDPWPTDSRERGVRGGSFFHQAAGCRIMEDIYSTRVDKYYGTLGVRLVRTR